METAPPRSPTPAHCSPATLRQRLGDSVVNCACAGALRLRQHRKDPAPSARVQRKPTPSLHRPHFCCRLQTNYLAGSGGSGPPLGRGRARGVGGPRGGAIRRSDSSLRLFGDTGCGAGGRGGSRQPMGAGGGPAGGEARGRGGRAPIRFHPVLPPPPRRVAAVRVVAARQCSSVTDPTSHLSPTPRRHDAQEEGERGRSTAPAGFGSGGFWNLRGRGRLGVTSRGRIVLHCAFSCRLTQMERRRRSPSAAPRGCRPSPPLPRWTRNRKRPRERIKHQTKKHR
ncbi:uncharacterized protein LOC116898343 [Rattus rattus]|uniref:uncharacterized protein LOC116898343 n=1 Tax=Rattus rattus TaxID=10117 RepID=UPI0013F30B33|nr:uncharacterized protein LOC116898343 [Rattus rattus]